MIMVFWYACSCCEGLGKGRQETTHHFVVNERANFIPGSGNSGNAERNASGGNQSTPFCLSTASANKLALFHGLVARAFPRIAQLRPVFTFFQQALQASGKFLLTLNLPFP
jgi:hypothetical protein